jgi:hypothetical protein
MSSAYGDDDYQPQSYQDDLATDDDATDPVMDEEGENPADELGVPEEELASELDKLNVDGEDNGLLDDDISDDERELIEDLDEDEGTLPANDR